MNARKCWLKKKGPQQVPRRGPVRREKPRPSISKPKPRAGRTSESGACRKEITRTILRNAWTKRFLEQLGTACIHAAGPEARRTRVVFHRRRSIRRLFPRLIGKLAGLRSSVIPVSFTAYPLMQAIYEGPGGQAWKDSKVQIYGWVNFSGNISTSHPSKTSENGNFPLIYDITPQPDGAEPDCSLPRAVGERKSNGPHRLGFSNLSPRTGLDYRFTTTRDGFFSDQLLKHNSYSGFDMPMIYLDLYIPFVASRE